MAELRKEIFESMGSISRTMNEVRHDYAVSCQKAFSAIFTTLDSVVDYVNSLDVPMVELFCETGQFYAVAKEHEKLPPMMFNVILTIIEILQGHRTEYLPLDAYLQQEKNYHVITPWPINDPANLKKAMAAVLNEYNEKYGATRGVVLFFQNYVSLADQIDITKSMMINRVSFISGNSSRYRKPLSTVPSFEALPSLGYKIEGPSPLPICYNWRNCWIEYGECVPDASACDIREQAEVRKMTIKKLTQTLYGWRSKFQHTGAHPPISNHSFMFLDGKDVVFNGLTLEKLEGIFERAFKNYFDAMPKPGKAVLGEQASIK